MRIYNFSNIARSTIVQNLAICCASVYFLGCQPPPPAVTVDPTIESIQANIFDKQCATVGCHNAITAISGLNLSAGNSYNNLVNIPSTQDSQFNLVQPGAPDSSYLVKKLDGTAALGSTMPKGRPALPQSQITAIRDWIQGL